MGVTVCKHKCGSFSVRHDDLLTLQSFTPWPLRIPKHVLDLLLKGPQLVSKAVIHAKTVSKQSILTQRDELQRLVDAWGQDNSQALFIACLDDVCKYLFEINEKLISDYAQCLGASLIGCISNTWDHGHCKGYRGKTEEQRISHSRKRNLPRT